MKYIFYGLLLFVSSVVLGADAKKDPDKKQVLPPSMDKEAEENIKRIFFKKLDPESILSDLPPKFVGLKDIESLDYEEMSKVYDTTLTPLIIPGFVFKKEAEPLAKVLGGLIDEEISGPGKKILVKLEGKESIEMYKKYSLLRLIGTFKSEKSKGKWYHYSLVGDVYPVEFESKKRAVILTLDFTIAQPGDILVPREEAERVVDPNLGERKPINGKARVISLREDDSIVTGEGGVVFIDKGSDDGITVNQILDVYPNQEKRGVKGSSPDAIGTIQIIDTKAQSSLGYVSLCTQEIGIGDMVY